MAAVSVSATPAPDDAGLPRRGGLAGLTPTGRARVPLGWALYDFANTIFSYAIVSYAMGLWLVEDTQFGKANGPFAFSVAIAVSVGLNAIVSPILGALSDRAGGRRLPYLLFFTLLCIVPTAFVGFSPADELHKIAVLWTSSYSHGSFDA